MTTPINKWLTTKEVSDILQVNIQTVRRYAREGKIKSVRLGNQIRFRPLTLDEFAKEQEEGIKT